MTSTTNTAASVEALIELALRTSDDKLAGVLAFEGRDHYVAFVSAWKARHAGVVASILTEKAFRRDKANPIPARNAAQERRQSLRGHSHALQVIRVAGKGVARAAREERLRTAAYDARLQGMVATRSAPSGTIPAGRGTNSPASV